MSAPDTEVCPRCAMMLHRELARFHQCKGTQLHLRPANIPVDQWNAALLNMVGTPLPAKPKPVPVRPAASPLPAWLAVALIALLLALSFATSALRSCTDPPPQVEPEPAP